MASASITRRRTQGSTRYVVRYRLGGRAYPIRHAGSFAREREARARRDLIAGELAAGRDPAVALAALVNPPKVQMLGDRFDAFVTSRRDVGPKAKALYRNARDKFSALLERDPTTLTPADFQEWIGANSNLSPRTLAHYLSTVRQVLDFADVVPNPARSPKVKLPTEEQGEVEIPNGKEWQAIKRHASHRILIALRLIEADGLRVSEAANLSYGDVDFADGRIRVSRAKTKRRTAGQRWLPVPVELLDEMAALCPLEDRTSERRVFGVSDDAIRKGHLRHRRASLWVAQNFDPITVREWCGHSRASMTLDVYSHVVTANAGDEWADFWGSAYDRRRRPKAPEPSPGVVPVWSESEAAA